MCCDFDMCYCNSICPVGCMCYAGDSRLGVNRIDCSLADLDFLPESIPEAATEILVDGNNLGTIPAMAFLGHEFTVALYLNNSEIHHLDNSSLKNLRNMRKLFVQDNSISVIHKSVFDDLHNLEEAYLQNNEIIFVESGSFASLVNLKVLNLEHNLLTTLSFQDFIFTEQLVSLRLIGNPWLCLPNFTCPLAGMVANLSTSVIKDASDIYCHHVWHGQFHKDRLPVNNRTHALLLSQEQCDKGDIETSPNHTYIGMDIMQTWSISFNVILAIVCATIACVFILIVIHQHWIEIYCCRLFGWVVLRLLKFKRRQGGNDELNDNRPYDAFISYSNMDSEFVLRELVKHLINRFNLCLLDRQLFRSVSVSEMITFGGQRSKRFILVLSDNFISHDWCVSEFKAAHEQAITDCKERVVIILLQNLQETQLDHTLSAVIHSQTCLKYDDPWFWEKLDCLMPDEKNNKFDRLPSCRDLEYMAWIGRVPNKLSALTLSGFADADFRSNVYEEPVGSVGSYDRINETRSNNSSIYSSGHYEEVTPTRFVHHQAGMDNAFQHSICIIPPPLPSVPDSGLLLFNAVNIGSTLCKDYAPMHWNSLSKDDNWV